MAYQLASHARPLEGSAYVGLGLAPPGSHRHPPGHRSWPIYGTGAVSPMRRDASTTYQGLPRTRARQRARAIACGSPASSPVSGSLPEWLPREGRPTFHISHLTHACRRPRGRRPRIPRRGSTGSARRTASGASSGGCENPTRRRSMSALVAQAHKVPGESQALVAWRQADCMGSRRKRAVLADQKRCRGCALGSR
jgi:hypothetical protein